MNGNNNIKKLSMRNDYVFREVLAKNGSEEFLKDFLNSFLKVDIKEIEILPYDTFFIPVEDDKKYGVIDMKTKLSDDTVMYMELQLVNYPSLEKRAFYFSSCLIGSQLDFKGRFDKLDPVAIIEIRDYECFTKENYRTKAVTVVDNPRDVILDTSVYYHYVELPKFLKRKKDLNDTVEQWLTFIGGENEEEILEAMSKNELIKKANDKLELLLADENVIKMANGSEKKLRKMALESEEKMNKNR